MQPLITRDWHAKGLEHLRPRFRFQEISFCRGTEIQGTSRMTTAMANAEIHEGVPTEILRMFMQSQNGTPPPPPPQKKNEEKKRGEENLQLINFFFY
mmetsp:Transcript_67094/g.119131  ORF Transcript_67094/g.119131 Transcript_67094/m.119131 type:complete len:97 (-) Transcript_67094:1-291(-)